MYITPSTTVGLALNCLYPAFGWNHCHTGCRSATFPVPMDVAAALYELCPLSNRKEGQSAVPCAPAGVVASPAQTQTSTEAAASRPATRTHLGRIPRNR